MSKSPSKRLKSDYRRAVKFDGFVGSLRFYAGECAGESRINPDSEAAATTWLANKSYQRIQRRAA